MDEMRPQVASTLGFHLRCLKEAGDPIPDPTTHVEEIAASAA
jgi:hypothetical protein